MSLPPALPALSASQGRILPHTDDLSNLFFSLLPAHAEPGPGAGSLTNLSICWSSTFDLSCHAARQQTLDLTTTNSSSTSFILFVCGTTKHNAGIRFSTGHLVQSAHNTCYG